MMDKKEFKEMCQKGNIVDRPILVVSDGNRIHFYLHSDPYYFYEKKALFKRQEGFYVECLGCGKRVSIESEEADIVAALRFDLCNDCADGLIVRIEDTFVDDYRHNRKGGLLDLVNILRERKHNVIDFPKDATIH